MEENTQNNNDSIIEFKIIVLGDSTVGKTSFILRFCEDCFEESNVMTIGIDTKTKYIKRNGQKIQLDIWDTAGQERFRTITKNCYRGSDGIILMYDISNKKTFSNIKNWIKSLKDSLDLTETSLILVGNKCDVSPDERQVNEEMKKEIIEFSGVNIIESSAKENINVNNCFVELVDQMIKLNVKNKGKKKYQKANSLKLNKKGTKEKKKCCSSNK